MNSRHFVQTREWAAIRQAQGHQPVWVGEELLLIKPAPKPFKQVGVMSQVYTQGLNWEELIATGKKNNLSHVQIDPNDERQQYEIPGELIKKYGMRPAESLLLRHTVLMDLHKSEEELLGEMKKNWRYNSLLALKKGVNVEVTDDREALEIFIKLYGETVEAKRFLARTPAYFRQVWEGLQPSGMAKIAVATYEGKPLVARFLGLVDGVIYTVYTGTSRENSDIKAAYGCLWEVIRWGKANGFNTINLWGVDPNSQEGDSYHGFSQFKLGFGGRVVEYAPAYDLVIDPIAYKAFKLANVARLTLLRLKAKL